MELEFTPIDLGRQRDYRQRLRQCTQIASDYSFINIWSWQQEYGLQWAWQDQLVWIRQSSPKPALWAPVGDWSAVTWSDAMAQAQEVCSCMIRIPEKLLEHWQGHLSDAVRITEAREHWDYLYARHDLANLKGNRFHKKKNLVNQFKKKYEHTYLPMGQEMVLYALEMQNNWCKWRDCENHDTLAAENRAIAKVLRNWLSLEGITGGALRVEEELASYTIAEFMPDNTLLIHFEKGDPDFKGSYQAINQLFVSRAEGQQFDLVNREQDLGDEGLRKAKMSYHPVDFVRKFRLEF
jgi:hypothetical protein